MRRRLPLLPSKKSLSLLFLFLAAGAARGASAPDTLRLLPPVVFEDEKGWTLAERMENATGKHAAAIAVHSVMAELYPLSANALDSLADVTLEAGDRAAARAVWQRVLETLPKDPNVSEEQKAALRTKAEAKVKQLAPKE